MEPLNNYNDVKQGVPYLVRNLRGQLVEATYKSNEKGEYGIWTVKGGGYLRPFDVDISEVTSVNASDITLSNQQPGASQEG